MDVIDSREFYPEDESLAWMMHGWYLQGFEDHDAAIADFDTAISLDPRNGQAYFYRGLSLEALGYCGEALDDMEYGARLFPEGNYGPAIEESPCLIPPDFAIVFNGLYCPRVQKDSVFYPANEIKLDVVVTAPDGSWQTTSFPNRNGAYQGVKAGTRKSGKGVTVWQGPHQPVTIQIVMWEVDDGGRLLDSLTEIAVDFALTRGTNTLRKYAVRQGANRAAAYAGGKAAQEMIKTVDLTGQISGHISSLPKALVGANNDLVGAIGIANVTPEAYPVLNQQAGFRYHLSTVHRGGGADCRTYFEFR
jgi:tetratricopeptide (TPR) repeat protein